MAANEALTIRVRDVLSHRPRIEEKKMFGGLAFMVNEKMCICVGKDRLMLRIAPEIQEKVLIKKGCETVKMKGREFKGYVYVNEEGLKSKEDFNYWIGLALDYNKRAKTAVKRKKI